MAYPCLINFLRRTEIWFTTISLKKLLRYTNWFQNSYLSMCLKPEICGGIWIMAHQCLVDFLRWTENWAKMKWLGKLLKCVNWCQNGYLLKWSKMSNFVQRYG